MLLVATALLASLALADDALDSARLELLAQAVPDGAVDPDAPGSRDVFLEVLASDLFLHAAVGPFDVYVMQADGYEKSSRAKKVLEAAVAGLEPVVPVMERFFGGEAGLIAGRRLPIVLAHADDGKRSFDQLIALLDWSEDDYSGWKQGGNPIWSPQLRHELTVRTWEVQLFNLAHKTAEDHGDAFLAHGLGYHTVAHVAARVLRQGAWGMVPPWLAQGLIDELDIAAYGEAWVGGDWWQRQVAGWSRPGWSGFVPQGSSPPPPVTGPPADLAVTVSKTGDSWQHRANSATRHWTELAADRRSEAPASFRFMAENESFLPRDRAYSRYMVHLLLDVARPEVDAPLTQLLDRVPGTPPSGMPDADPLPVVIHKALGGVKEIDEFESMAMGDMLEVIGRPEIVRRLETLGAREMLDLTDHREQARWLYRHTSEEMDADVRNEIWTLILAAEYYQQLHEWRLIGEVLDRGAEAVFDASASYPKREAARAKVREAFLEAIKG